MTDNKKDSKKVSTVVIDKFNTAQKWTSTNILPIIALPSLAVLAADSVRAHLAHVSDTSALIVAIIVAAVLAILAHK